MRLATLLSIIILVFSVNSGKSQAIACNDQINFSLDNEGNGTLIPEMILEGDTSGLDPEITLSDGMNILLGPAPSLEVNCNYIGEYILTVTDLNTGNSCWGEIIIEDKLNVCDFGGNAIVVSNGFCTGYDLILNENEALTPVGPACARILPELIPGENTVSIDYDDIESLNGVSTLDLVLMWRGIVFGFNSPVQAVLADVDNDGTVSTVDIITTRLVILGIEDDAIIEDLRIFRLDDDYAGFDPYFMTQDYSVLKFDDSEFNNTNNIYIDVFKTGDINQSAFPGFNEEIIAENRSSLDMRFQDRYLEAGKKYQVEFSVNHAAKILGLTAGIEFDGIELLDLQSNHSAQELMHNLSDDQMLISFLSLDGTDEIKFSLEILAKEDGYLSEQMGLSELMSNDLVVQGDEEINVSLRAEEREIYNEHIIYPNPVNESLTIRFDNNSEGLEKTLRLRNLNGKLLAERTTTLDDYQLELNQEMPSGMYIIEILSDDDESYLKFLKL